MRGKDNQEQLPPPQALPQKEQAQAVKAYTAYCKAYPDPAFDGDFAERHLLRLAASGKPLHAQQLPLLEVLLETWGGGR